MTPEQRQIVQDTWQQVITIADTAAQMFYARLFAIDPTTRPLFKAESLAEQRRKLMQVLGVAVHGLAHLDDLLPVVEDLGRRHERYGVTAAHYDSVGSALLWTLEQGLGKAWSADAKAAWSEAYALFSGVMQRASVLAAA